VSVVANMMYVVMVVVVVVAAAGKVGKMPRYYYVACLTSMRRYNRFLDVVVVVQSIQVTIRVYHHLGNSLDRI
jgi:hypothetical protein